MTKPLLSLLLSVIAIRAFSQEGCFNQPEFTPHLIQTDSGNIFAPDFDKYLDSYVGCEFPSFDVTTLKGKKIVLKEVKDKVVVLNFWYTSCGGCIREFPALNKLVDEFSDKDVEFISFALDKKKSLDTFLVKHPFKYEIIPDSKSLFDKYRVYACPFSVILDKSHKVVKMLHNQLLNKYDVMENYDRIKPRIVEALRK